MSDDDLKAELERLRNENAALKKGASSAVRMKVSEKGAVSVYGMGRFPVTLYKEQRAKSNGSGYSACPMKFVRSLKRTKRSSRPRNSRYEPIHPGTISC
jgi:hypothetical protein